MSSTLPPDDKIRLRNVTRDPEAIKASVYPPSYLRDATAGLLGYVQVN